jgi:hypothetical protein
VCGRLCHEGERGDNIICISKIGVRLFNFSGVEIGIKVCLDASTVFDCGLDGIFTLALSCLQKGTLGCACSSLWNY